MESLLQSQNLHIISVATGERESNNCNEILWEDPFGPLKISRVAAGGAFYCLTLGDEIAVSIYPEDRLAVLSAPGTPQSTIIHFLTDQILPRVLSQRAELVLHAGAVRDEEFALLLLGRSGGGKSTLVTSFKQRGWTLMGDDAIILSSGDGMPLARAVYPSLRLLPDSIDALFAGPIISHDMAHFHSKRRIDVTGQLEVGPTPVKAMFVLASDEPIAVRRLSTAQACMAIVENSFALDPTDREKARSRLERASELARQIPAFALSYPRDYARLPEVRAAILNELRGL